jgi:hypothetical protein
MAYRDTKEALWLIGQAPTREIRLGEVERQLILRARRDAQARRPGERVADPRLEALRLYAMLGRYRRDGAHALIAAGFSPAERRVIDAMLDALPMRARRARPVTGRLVWALLILLPMLVAASTYGWANHYLQDRLIAFVLGGLALLLLVPFANACAPTRRPGC